MSGHLCPDCQRCPECGRSAWCEGDRILVVPCEHHGYCPDCNLDNCRECRTLAQLEEGVPGYRGDPWENKAAPPDPDPWGPLAAESRKVTDRFWANVGDRSHVTKKDDKK